MSDLQCPARFLLLAGELPDAGALRHERVAAVYAATGSPGDGADRAAELARAVGVPVREMTAVLWLDEVVGRNEEALGALEDLADLHRGETVLVAVADGGSRSRRVDVAVDGDGLTVEEVSRGVAT